METIHFDKMHCGGKTIHEAIQGVILRLQEQGVLPDPVTIKRLAVIGDMQLGFFIQLKFKERPDHELTLNIGPPNMGTKN